MTRINSECKDIWWTKDTKAEHAKERAASGENTGFENCSYTMQ